MAEGAPFFLATRQNGGSVKEVSPCWNEALLSPSDHLEPPIPDPILERWQEIVNLLAFPGENPIYGTRVTFWSSFVSELSNRKRKENPGNHF